MDWITKTKVREENHVGDVDIHLTKSGKKKMLIIRFLKHCHKKITNNYYLVCGTQESRLYFKSTQPKEGYKLSGTKPIEKSASVFFKVAVARIPVYTEGEFYLVFDSRLELWFIDFKEPVTYDGVKWNRRVR